MNNVVTVKGVKIGDGIPKICVPIVGKTLQEIKKEAKALANSNCHIIEWRADFFNEANTISKVEDALVELKSILVNKPIIFTFRNETSYCLKLYKHIINTGLADIIDIDLKHKQNNIKNIVSMAHAKNIAVIVSSHDFLKTPQKHKIIQKMKKAQSLGDISKIAVMPNSLKDVITLLDATQVMKSTFSKPFITVSMSSLGVISRLCVEDFGCAITFASLNEVSAPGQISLLDMEKVLKIIHLNKKK